MLAITQAAEPRRGGDSRAQRAGNEETVSAATVATTLVDVETLRELWQSFTPSDIDADIDYYLNVVACHEQVLSPFVVHIRREGRPDMLAVARLERLPLSFRLGYKRLFEAELRAIVLSFGGILGAKGREDEDAAMRELGRLLKDGAADILLMRNLDAEGSLCAAALASASKVRIRTGSSSRRWVAQIPDRFETFMEVRTPRTQSKLSRQERQLRKRFGNGLRLCRFDAPERIEELLVDMEAVASRSYQRTLGVGFMGSPMQRALIATGLRQGWHATWMLYLNGAPAAFWNGFRYNGTFYVGTPGYDPAYAKDSVGTFTLLEMIKDLCADPAVHRLDFGQGEADYKSAFGEPALVEHDVTIAAPWPWPILVLAAFSIFSTFNARAKLLAERSGYLKSLKALWRRAGAGGR